MNLLTKLSKILKKNMLLNLAINESANSSSCSYASCSTCKIS